MTPMTAIVRAATRGDRPLNIICLATHERYQTNLARTGHEFWMVPTPHLKDWKEEYAPLPENIHRLTLDGGRIVLPNDVCVDLVMAEHRFGAFQMLAPIANTLQVPLLCLEHTLPNPGWPAGTLEGIKSMKAHVNVFISEFSREKWGWAEDEAVVVHHGVDIDTFKPGPGFGQNFVLSVVNELNDPSRHFCCGYPFWQQVTAGLPITHLGGSKDGWSQPAKSVADLVQHYRNCAVFIDTAASSPIPTVVLEAMSTGALVVSRGNAMVPEVIQDGRNGFIREDPAEFRTLLLEVLENPQRYDAMREAARQTILDRFSLKRFVRDWDRVLRAAANTPWLGPIS